jgi:hypothetical protein
MVLEHTTTERLTPARDQAAAAGPRSAADLCADLDERLLEGCQRPILDRLRRRQRAQKVVEIVGQRMKLETDGVRGERPT